MMKSEVLINSVSAIVVAAIKDMRGYKTGVVPCSTRMTSFSSTIIKLRIMGCSSDNAMILLY